MSDRRCSTCNSSGPFAANKNNHDELHHQCKHCINTLNAAVMDHSIKIKVKSLVLSINRRYFISCSIVESLPSS